MPWHRLFLYSFTASQHYCWAERFTKSERLVPHGLKNVTPIPLCLARQMRLAALFLATSRLEKNALLPTNYVAYPRGFQWVTRPVVTGKVVMNTSADLRS